MGKDRSLPAREAGKKISLPNFCHGNFKVAISAQLSFHRTAGCGPWTRNGTIQVVNALVRKPGPAQHTSIRVVRIVATGIFKENDSLAINSLELSVSSYLTLRAISSLLIFRSPAILQMIETPFVLIKPRVCHQPPTFYRRHSHCLGTLADRSGLLAIRLLGSGCLVSGGAKGPSFLSGSCVFKSSLHACTACALPKPISYVTFYISTI